MLGEAAGENLMAKIFGPALCFPEKQLLLDLQKLKEWHVTNIGKIRENNVKNNLEGAQHLGVAASVTIK